MRLRRLSNRSVARTRLPLTPQLVPSDPQPQSAEPIPHMLRTPADLLNLQRVIGNQAVQRMLTTHGGKQTYRPTHVQRKGGKSDKKPLNNVLDTEKVTVGKVYQMRKGWYDAAIEVIGVHEKTEERNKIALSTLKEQYEREAKMSGEGKDDDLIIDSKEMERIFPVDLPEKLYSQISKAVNKPIDEIRNQLKDAYIRVLNNQREWKPIEKEINFGTDDKPETYTSTITPVNEEYHPTFKKYGKTGLGSMSPRLSEESRTPEENKRTTNLAYTEYREGKADDKDGKVLFAAFRSGALSGKGLKDKDKNWEATLANTKELLLAMVVKHYENASNTEKDAMMQNGTKIDVLSTSLQSGGMGGEKKMIEEQMRALRSFHNTKHLFELTIAVPGGETKMMSIFATFNVIAFSFGVNAQGGTDSIGQWWRNREAFKALEKAVADYLAMSAKALKQHEQDLINEVEKVDIIGEQIIEIRQKNTKIEQLWAKIKAGRGGSTGDYKMASRIANLAFLMEYMVHFNCKSGKDRTGVMDAEAKYLAHQMNQAEQQNKAQVVPEHTLKTEKQKEEHQKMLFESGSLEMQQLNTGGQGYKIAPATTSNNLKIGLVEDVELKERVGGAEVLQQLQGLKRYTDIDHI